MARDGKVSLGRKQITMQLGQLFVDRASINLHSDILDNPDYFWEDDEWLHVYTRAAKYLEVERRYVDRKPKVFLRDVERR